VTEVAPALLDDIAAAVEAGSVIPAGEAARLVEVHGLVSVEALALAALPVAAELARAPISSYRVAAVGIEAELGDLVLGGNVEFPGTELTTTVHAEGFVSLRARRRGRALATLAVRSARPCAHCRQTLAEAASADGLALIGLEGHRVSLDDLYPLAFRPAALGVTPDEPGARSWAGVIVAATGDAPGAVGEALLDAGERAHAPYSGAPSAVALETRDGRILSAGCVESVAFNPSITAMQAALVELVAARVETADVTDAWLARTPGGAVDPEPGFRALAAAALPTAAVHVVDWRVARR
jgi:cytidine deaminase